VRSRSRLTFCVMPSVLWPLLRRHCIPIPRVSVRLWCCYMLLQIPPGRNLYQPLSELLAMVRRGDRPPGHPGHPRRKAPPPGSSRSRRAAACRPAAATPAAAAAGPTGIGDGFTGGFGPRPRLMRPRGGRT